MTSVLGVTGILVLLLVCEWLLIAAVWTVAKEIGMLPTIDLSGIQNSVAVLVTRVGTLEQTVVGVGQDYTTLKSRVQALEAAYAANDPVAVQVAINDLNAQLDVLGGRVQAAGGTLAELDQSVDPPPSPIT